MTLCRERLNRLLKVLNRQGGSETVRQLIRRFSFFRSEITQAEGLGWITIEQRKPRTGRPSSLATLSNSIAAKLPQSRFNVEKPIKRTHRNFAMHTVYSSVKGGGKKGSLPGYVEAYRRSFNTAKSIGGAYASCSRLLRHPHVFAARQWHYARANGEIPNFPFPSFESEIWEQLEIFGSERAKYKPTSGTFYRERRW